MSYNPTHDTGASLNGTRHVTAFFDSAATAEKARADLVAAGLSPDTIKVASADATASQTPIEEGGFWHALKEFFMPDEDRFSYAEGLRRGGVALSVETGDANYERAIDILDADGAVDIDEREQSWRAEGWSGFTGVPDPTAVTMAGGEASTAGFGASLAGEDGYARPASLTTSGTADAESRADAGRVGAGPDEPGLLNPDMRERIGSGTASMTPPTPSGQQDATLGNNAATRDRRDPVYPTAADATEAALGSPTRSGLEAPQVRSTIGSVTAAEADVAPAQGSTAWHARRDEAIRRTRVRGYIVDPADRAQSGL